MVVFPNAKINIGLNVTAKRADGFHELKTVFYPIGLSDILEVIENTEGAKDEFTSSGIDIPGNAAENICLKALAHLRESFKIPPLKVHLHKLIPIGAGLGGGSSDAAFFIKAVDKLFSLKLSKQEQIQFAQKSGSDCAFFIINKAVYAEGRGDELSLVNLILKGYYLVLLNPGIHISTAEAYSGVKPEQPKSSLKGNVLNIEIHGWKGEVENDFEKAIFINYPEIKQIKDELYQVGAIYAAMSGSGSSIYGIFKEQPNLSESLKKHLYWEGELD